MSKLVVPIDRARIPYPPKGVDSPISKRYVDTLPGIGQGTLDEYRWRPIDLPYRTAFVWTNTYGRVVYLASSVNGGPSTGAACSVAFSLVTHDEDGETTFRPICATATRAMDSRQTVMIPVGSDESIRCSAFGLPTLEHYWNIFR